MYEFRCHLPRQSSITIHTGAYNGHRALPGILRGHTGDDDGTGALLFILDARDVPKT